MCVGFFSKELLSPLKKGFLVWVMIHDGLAWHTHVFSRVQAYLRLSPRLLLQSSIFHYGWPLKNYLSQVQAQLSPLDGKAFSPRDKTWKSGRRKWDQVERIAASLLLLHSFVVVANSARASKAAPVACQPRTAAAAALRQRVATKRRH